MALRKGRGNTPGGLRKNHKEGLFTCTVTSKYLLAFHIFTKIIFFDAYSYNQMGSIVFTTGGPLDNVDIYVVETNR